MLLEELIARQVVAGPRPALAAGPRGRGEGVGGAFPQGAQWTGVAFDETAERDHRGPGRQGLAAEVARERRGVEARVPREGPYAEAGQLPCRQSTTGPRRRCSRVFQLSHGVPPPSSPTRCRPSRSTAAAPVSTAARSRSARRVSATSGSPRSPPGARLRTSPSRSGPRWISPKPATRLADRADALHDEVWDAAATHFDEKQLAALVLMVGVTNLKESRHDEHAEACSRLPPRDQ